MAAKSLKTVKPVKPVKPVTPAKPVKPAAAATLAATTAAATASAVLRAPGSPAQYRARVRMYRHGLGDCFLLTFPRPGQSPFNMLIDCGALARNKGQMSAVVEHIRDTVRDGAGPAVPNAKARLDVVVGTHEHKDHVSGFNQARQVFNSDFDFGAVWLAWTENLGQPEIRKIKETRKSALKTLKAALAASPLAVAGGPLRHVPSLLGFSDDDDSTDQRRVADAMEYLKLRGRQANALRFLEPGGAPFALGDVEDVRVYVLGPPRDPSMLKTSAVTERMKSDDVVYHLGGAGAAAIDALAAAVPAMSSAGATTADPMADRFQPFSPEHRVSRKLLPQGKKVAISNRYFAKIMGGVQSRYDDPQQRWRRIDDDWLGGFGQLALDLDNDTNNTSLVLAFEFVSKREVLLFVADAQVGSWLSWKTLKFDVPGQAKALPALDLLRRTVFYKVGHHCSHNATLKAGGLELMQREDLVAFIALDKETARNQGPKEHGGWAMPAPQLFKALGVRANERVVISDIKEPLSAKAAAAGVRATNTFIDYFLV